MDNQKVSELSVNSRGQTKAERLERERLDIEHDGYMLLGLPFVQPPSTFTFDESDIETNRLAWRIQLWELTGGGRPLSEVPDEIPAEYVPEIKSILEPRARRDYEIDVERWPERVKEREGYVAKARALREKVAPAIELLRAACEPDPNGAHRPIYLGHVWIDATACLDCEWFTHTNRRALGRDGFVEDISNHRSLHWDPPHDELCDLSFVGEVQPVRGREERLSSVGPHPARVHPVSENVYPQRLPSGPNEKLGFLVYAPVAVIRKYWVDYADEASGSYWLCESCNGNVYRTGPTEDEWDVRA
jgi:hypothetical protein